MPVSEAHLLAELARALAYPKLRRRVSRADAQDLVDLLRDRAVVIADPAGPPPVRSPDPGDDYLLALASVARAVIVSGDSHLLGLADRAPVHARAEFWRMVTGD
jgi:predicted nucleic acid-binding protein